MNSVSKKGLMIAAPSSGSGKTLLTLALLRVLKKADVDTGAAKAGPDYIDPGFHRLASGRQSVNLDPWAMCDERLLALAHQQAGTHLLVEAMMGLFDGASDGSASPATLAKTLDMPVVLVIDAAKQSHSVAALARGFRDHDQDVSIAGVILNKVGSPRHEVLLRNALKAAGFTVLGAVPRSDELAMPERHLGLIQAEENPKIDSFIENAAQTVRETCDLPALLACFDKLPETTRSGQRMPPPGQRVAIARDVAFSFLYPHLLADWRNQGAELSFFSPLKDEAPQSSADAVFLPGGYPELHAGTLSGASRFQAGLAAAARRNVFVYGECGGYMVLGEGIVDRDGASHQMCGLLQLETSFENRKLHLGYRRIEADGFIMGERFNGHEFHYTTAKKELGDPLFSVTDTMGETRTNVGLRQGSVMGSYMHLIDKAV